MQLARPLPKVGGMVSPTSAYPTSNCSGKLDPGSHDATKHRNPSDEDVSARSPLADHTSLEVLRPGIPTAGLPLPLRGGLDGAPWVVPRGGK